MKVSVVFVTCFLVAEGFTFAANYKNVTRLKRQASNCGAAEYKCLSGQCISEDNVCDGSVECTDGSDESSICKNNICPSYGFRCAYGACINSVAKCDGKKDCRDNSDEAASICKDGIAKPGSCDVDQFQCNNGDCIEDSNQCDGIENCADGSDETVQVCAAVKCPAFSFKCAYGACINPDLRCNHRKDCADGSDERDCDGNEDNTPTPPTIATPPTRPWTPVTPPIRPQVPTGNDCLLPSHPEHGKWKLLVDSALGPGEIVKAGTVLQFECNPTFKLKPNFAISLCTKNWSQIPKCIRTCPSIPKKKNLIASCSLDGSNILCDDSPYEGTTAILQCADLYEDPSLSSKPYRYCQDGSWDYALPNCEPVCGLKSVDAEQLIIKGNNATRGEFPWHVGIYVNLDYVCGGSIITPKLVLSAAHCFESTATEIYLVAAGKYYRQYNESKDDQAQFSKINELIIHEDYNGGSPFEAFDLAVLVLADPFKMTRYVLPVCLDVRTDFDLSNLVHRVGIVIGWGWTSETGNASDILKYLEVEYKTKKTCDLPHDFLQYYVPYAKDKLCAGVRNQGQSACKGDSGGSLVFPNDLGRYFLRGIVSVAPRKKGFICDSNQYALFTSVKEHIPLIEKLKSRYRL